MEKYDQGKWEDGLLAASGWSLAGNEPQMGRGEW